MTEDLFYVSNLKFEKELERSIEKLKQDIGRLINNMNARGTLGSSSMQTAYRQIADNNFITLIESLIEDSIRDLKDAGALTKDSKDVLLARVNDKANTIVIDCFAPQFHRNVPQTSAGFPASAIEQLQKSLQNKLIREAEIKLRESLREPEKITQPEKDASYRGTPIGSPYGFSDIHWNEVQRRKESAGTLYVVFGYQFKSEHYDTETLKANIAQHLSTAIDKLRAETSGIYTDINLEFKPLAAGYGEHLFNNIALDIIGSDIAIFETSDLNPNVMIEMGVALTWGVKVVPIKLRERPIPPSDISGQTYLDYKDSGQQFLDPDFHQKLKEIFGQAAHSKRH